MLYLYTAFKSGPPDGWILAGLVLVLCLLALRTPRWAVYAFVVCSMAVLVGWSVFVDAERADDVGSDRDDAVEIAARALLHGSNPWGQKSTLNLPITTGPSSILIALPFAATTGRINGLTFIAWCAFLCCLVLADIRQRNNTFLTICLLLLFPWFGFLHTLHWGLDELYYAAILAPLLWQTLARGRLEWAGAIGGFMALSRLSYAPAVLAAGLWWVLKERRTFRGVLRVGLGGMAYVVTVIGFFWLREGSEFLQKNFWLNSQTTPLRHGDNPVAVSVGALLGVLPPGTLGSSVVVLFLTALASLAMRRLDHPFFHMAVALVLAHSISFSPSYPMDYQLTFLVPALYGFAFSSTAPVRAAVVAAEGTGAAQPSGNQPSTRPGGP
jgi:hypothetical protein